MKRVTLRTLILTLELLAAVVAFQYMASIRAVHASAVWLGGSDAIAIPAPCEANDCAIDT